jgi:hypothetical protein
VRGAETTGVGVGTEGGGVFDEETAGDGGVGVEGNLEFAEEREEGGFGEAGDGVVVSLEDGGEDGGGCFLDGVDLLDLGGGEVANAQLLQVLAVVVGVGWKDLLF